jgi:hypothetical protein
MKIESGRLQHAGARPLAQHDMVLLAMASASGWTTRKIPYEDLVLEAWRQFPAEFSLRNHPEHPDASDIHKRLYQTLKPKGFVVSLGNKVFRLTDGGLEAARQLDATLRGSAGRLQTARLARDEQAFLEQAANSRAFATWVSGQRDQLIDYDARMFFQFSTGTPVAERRLRVQFADQALAKAASLGAETANEMAALSQFLQERFSHLLTEDEGRKRAN